MDFVVAIAIKQKNKLQKKVRLVFILFFKSPEEKKLINKKIVVAS